MAFGKNPEHLNNMPSFGQGTFGQQVNTSDKKPNAGRSGGGGTPYWKEKFHLSEYATHPTHFRLLRGDYSQQYMVEGQMYQDTFPYFMYTEHGRKVNGRFRGGICSAGPMRMDREKREPCQACDFFWDEYQQRKDDKAAGGQGKQPKSMSMVDKFAFSVLDYGYFFEMPDVDQHGQVRTKRDGTPWTHWEKAFNTQDPKFANKNWTEGRVVPWGISNSWRTSLVNQNTIIGSHCGSCGQGHVHSKGWHCGNPQCRQLILDPNNTTMTPDQQDSITKNPHHCPHCGHHGYPHEEVQCSSCSDGKRATIFEVDLWGFLEKSGESRAGKLIITQFLIQPPQFQTQYATKVEPLNLPNIFTPTPVEKQGELYGISGAGQMQQQQHTHQQAPQQWGAPPAPPAGPGAPQHQAVDPNAMNAQLAQNQGWNPNNNG